MICKTASRVILGFLFLIAGITALSPILVEREQISSADAIIVIGGDHKPERMRTAARLYSTGVSPIVIISSGTQVLEGGEMVIESELMAAQGIQAGLPSDAVRLEQKSLSTEGNAKYSYAICQEIRCKSIVLVTSAYHSRRAGVVFREVYSPQIKVTVYGADQAACPPCFPVYTSQLYVAWYEYVNWVKYWLSNLGLVTKPTD